MTRSLWRLAATAIAVAGAIDPIVTRQSVAPQSVVIAMIDADTLKAGDRPSARGERASAVVASLRIGLAGDHDVFVRTHRQGSLAAACPAHGRCVVVSDGAVPRRLTDGAQVIGGVRLDAAERPRLTIVGVDAPATASPHSMAQLRLRLRAIGARGDSHMQVFDAGALVGEATHTWRETAAVDEVDESITVSWVPLASGPRRIRVVVSALENEETLADNQADLVVDVRVEPTAVLMYEPEATWLGTFVRRALEDDPRFQVRGRVRMAPPVTVSRRGGGSLTRAWLLGARLRQARQAAQCGRSGDDRVTAAPSHLEHGRIARGDRSPHW
jgi:hypothetical protein